MRALTFAKRNFLEILRDPISYVFGVGLPVLMLIAMTVINSSVPQGVELDIFKIQNLSCGVAVFGLCFVMLSGAILVSKDKTGAFLTRLYTSPMRAHEFIIGYAIPLLCVALVQMMFIFGASAVVGLIVKSPLNLLGALLSIVALFPSAVFFVALGIAFGFLFNQTSAPPVCSFVITFAGLLGGIWFDCTSVGGFIETICRILPFFNAVLSARGAMALKIEAIPLIVITVYAIACAIFACVSFKLHRKIK